MFDEGRLLLVGATGLVGGEIMRLSAEHPDLRLTALTRREAPMPPGVCMEMLVADPENWAEAIGAVVPRAVICALACPRAQAASEEAFRAVDHDLVLAVGRAARAAGVEGFVLVSSAGANPYAREFHPRVKGETETALGKLGLPRLHVLRPGPLRGGAGEGLRPLKALARLAGGSAADPLFGSVRPRPMPLRTLAEAAVHLALSRQRGRFVHEHEAILRAARQFERAAA